MFYESESLVSVTIPNSVTSIGNFAFTGCESLANITIPYGVSNIDSSAFDYCTTLTSINVDNANINYCSENGVLFNKSKTVLIRYPAGKQGNIYSVPNSVTDIGYGAFYSCINLADINIPNSVTNIDSFAFYKCKSLKNATLPDRLAAIGGYMFYDCENLTSVTIPNSITSIGSYAFWGCKSLTSIQLPNDIMTIREGAFSFCEGFTNVIIPASVTSISHSVFNNCTGLKDVMFLGNAPYISSNVFDNTHPDFAIYYNPSASDWTTPTWNGYKSMPFDKTKYNIATTAKTGGTASGGGTVNEGESVTLTAMADNGYTFDGWYENNVKVSGTAVYTFTATANRTLEARFKVSEFYQSFIEDEVQIWADAGVIPVDATFTVNKIMPPPLAVTEKVNDQLGAGTIIVAYYEITLQDAEGNSITHLSGEITISTKLPDGCENGNGVSAYQQDENGNLIKMEAWVEDGYIYYKTTWLETY